MKNKRVASFFGIGPLGVAVTLLIWGIFYLIETELNIPKITIHPFFRVMLMSLFAMDALYLLIGSNYQLRKSGRGKTLMTNGPYQFIRHPIYSVWIFSFTGILAVVIYSWGIIISVVPISIIWSWLVQREENDMLNKFGDKYRSYIEQTGQFLPSWKAMKENTKT